MDQYSTHDQSMARVSDRIRAVWTEEESSMPHTRGANQSEADACEPFVSLEEAACPPVILDLQVPHRIIMPPVSIKYSSRLMI